MAVQTVIVFTIVKATGVSAIKQAVHLRMIMTQDAIAINGFR